MAQTVERPAGDETGRALDCLAWRLDTPEYTRSPHDPQALAGLRQERQIEHVHALGPRVFAEMLDEIAVATGRPDIVADRVEAYSRLDPEAVRFVGGDKFPPMPLGVVR